MQRELNHGEIDRTGNNSLRMDQGYNSIKIANTGLVQNEFQSAYMNAGSDVSGSVKYFVLEDAAVN